MRELTEADTDIADVLALERELQTAPARGDADRLRQLLSPEFVEVGASGRQWDLPGILAMLDDEAAAVTPSIEVHDLAARRLSPDIIQVFWTSHRGSRRARRTSLWCRTDGQWRQVYHQGTPLT